MRCLIPLPLLRNPAESPCSRNEGKDDEMDEVLQTPSPPVLPPPPLPLRDHADFFKAALRGLPQRLVGADGNRLVLAHFAVHALDLLGDLSAVDKPAIINWIYSLQVEGGFLGGPGLGRSCDANSASDCCQGQPHLAMTYAALATLLALGDDLAGVDADAIAAMLRTTQGSNGCFQALAQGSERDVRFVYCAAAVAHMLGDWRGVDRAAAAAYVQRCRAYDGGFGLMPSAEAHGGATYCAVAALQLLSATDLSLDTLRDEESVEWERDRLVWWLALRQRGSFGDDYSKSNGGGSNGGGGGGLQGRPNKAADSCYSFWVGASLSLLGASDVIDPAGVRRFVRQCQCFPGEQKYVSGNSAVGASSSGCTIRAACVNGTTSGQKESSSCADSSDKRGSGGSCDGNGTRERSDSRTNTAGEQMIADSALAPMVGGGGFAKVPGGPPDILHSFYSVCWLALSGEPGVAPLDCVLGISRQAAGRVSARRRRHGTDPGDFAADATLKSTETQATATAVMMVRKGAAAPC
ncbi:unnamed protein product [Phaeothamnion confervicola]